MARNSQLPLGVVYAIITFVPPKGTWPDGKKFPVAPRCGVCHYYFRATKGHVARWQEIPSCPSVWCMPLLLSCHQRARGPRARNSQLPLGVVYAIITFVPPKGTWPEGKKFPVAPAVQCTMILSCQYFIVYGGMQIARSWTQFTGI